jgi:enoyl-CoA hydratase
MSDVVTYSQTGDIATLTMDDGKANALAPAMSAGLSAGLDRAAKEAKAVVIRGRPGVLCGGYDLKIIRGDDDALKAKMRDMGTEVMLRLYQSPQPIIFACTGHGVAAGAILLMAADLRIGLQGDFKIGLNETGIGLALPYVGLEFARDRLAPTELQQATVMAKLYDPVSAVAAGYLDQAVQAEAFDATVQTAAEGLAALDVEAFAETKRRLRQPVVDRILALS